MTEPRRHDITCTSPAGTHRMAYWEWGDPQQSRVLICVHGLTRTGRDFDVLARRLSSHYRVVCPDLVGRGQSGWLADPAYYTVLQYAADMAVLIQRLRPTRLDWVGTSLGGLVGMALNNGIRLDKLVLNDVGPHLPTAALERIGRYTGESVRFSSLAEACVYVRETASPFGQHSDEQWEALTRHVYRQEGAHWVKHYDLGIAAPSAQYAPAALVAGELLLWQAFTALTCPVLILRGALSDLLTCETALEMLQRQPLARLLEVPAVGHAPTLMQDSQVEPVVRFLLDDDLRT